MASMPVLEIRNVSKHFGPIKALTDVSFDLEKGEIHALCGENGAGKSTLMNIIAGVLQPSEGEILARWQAGESGVAGRGAIAWASVSSTRKSRSALMRPWRKTCSWRRPTAGGCRS